VPFLKFIRRLLIFFDTHLASPRCLGIPLFPERVFFCRPDFVLAHPGIDVGKPSFFSSPPLTVRGSQRQYSPYERPFFLYFYRKLDLWRPFPPLPCVVPSRRHKGTLRPAPFLRAQSDPLNFPTSHFVPSPEDRPPVFLIPPPNSFFLTRVRWIIKLSF